MTSTQQPRSSFFFFDSFFMNGLIEAEIEELGECGGRLVYWKGNCAQNSE